MVKHLSETCVFAAEWPARREFGAIIVAEFEGEEVEFPSRRLVLRVEGVQPGSVAEKTQSGEDNVMAGDYILTAFGGDVFVNKGGEGERKLRVPVLSEANTENQVYVDI